MRVDGGARHVSGIDAPTDRGLLATGGREDSCGSSRAPRRHRSRRPSRLPRPRRIEFNRLNSEIRSARTRSSCSPVRRAASRSNRSPPPSPVCTSPSPGRSSRSSRSPAWPSPTPCPVPTPRPSSPPASTYSSSSPAFAISMRLALWTAQVPKRRPGILARCRLLGRDALERDRCRGRARARQDPWSVVLVRDLGPTGCDAARLGLGSLRAA